MIPSDTGPTTGLTRPVADTSGTGSSARLSRGRDVGSSPEQHPEATELPAGATQRATRRAVLSSQVRKLIRAISDGDDGSVEVAVLQLSHRRRIFAPLALAVGAIVMLFKGLKLLFSDWRLSLIQILPAMWIWAAMLDLKLHVLGKKEFRLWYGPTAVLLVLAVALISVASFYLNAVFAFAISRPGKPQIRPAFALARRHFGAVAGFGFGVGLALGYSIAVVPHWGLWWFAFSMSIVVGLMMLTYVTVPARLVGIKPNSSRRDKLAAGVVGGAVGAIVCTPPYAIARLGIVLLGSHSLFVLGIILLVLGFGLQSGATGAVKAIKMSSKLATGKLAAERQSSAAEDG
jgi:hypothetical protein